jgi:hypothetical protein
MMEQDGAETGFTEAETETLRSVSGLVVPASPEHGVPGADDALIFSDILATAKRQHVRVRAALSALDAAARMGGGKDFLSLDPAARERVVGAFREADPKEAGLIEALVVQCYYRDARVMRALGMADRAPFPEGFEVSQGDWSLLDPVRARAPLYREP